MKRVATVAAVLVALALAAGVAASTKRSSASGPTKLTIWVGWSAGTHELKVFNSLVNEYNAKQKAIHVDVVGDIVDAKIVAAIRSGTAPDIVSSFNSYNVGNYCGTGAWIDLTPYLKRDKISLSLFPPATRYYTQYAGKQ